MKERSKASSGTTMTCCEPVARQRQYLVCSQRILNIIFSLFFGVFVRTTSRFLDREFGSPRYQLMLATTQSHRLALSFGSFRQSNAIRDSPTQ
jgi:hypothetical protein